MLVICNGAIKSGSTWLYNILANLEAFESPPDRYLTLRSRKSPCIRPNLLSEFLENEDCANRHYLSKNHISKPEHQKLLLECQHAYVFDIERDPRDVVVSNYYHDCFRNGYDGTFDRYYWEEGREVAARLASYHDNWRGTGPRVYISSYERLHNEFGDEVRRIAAVLGRSLDDSEVARLRERTSMTTLRRDYKNDPRYQGEKFFRKGKVGDWRNHFDRRKLDDLERVLDKGIGRFDRHRVRAALRRRLRG